MSIITFESKAFKVLYDKIDFLEKTIKAMASNNGFSKWISEEETMLMTGLSKSSLLKKRKAAIFNWTSATGRKIKYLRKDVENYLNNNSTLRRA